MARLVDRTLVNESSWLTWVTGYWRHLRTYPVLHIDHCKSYNAVVLLCCRCLPNVKYILVFGEKTAVEGKNGLQFRDIDCVSMGLLWLRSRSRLCVHLS